MPVDFEDPEADPRVDGRKNRFAAPSTPWWRPKGTWGRAFLGFAALIAACAFFYAVHVVKTFLEHDARFRINGTSSIQASGLAEVSRAEMLPVFGEDVGRNIFFVPLADRRKQLEQIPWVQRATVMRILPDQIRVSVVERQPVAFVRHGQQIGLVDANGVLLSMPAAMMAQHHYSFPVLTGIDDGDPLPSRKARMDLYERLVSELDSTGQHLSNQISEIDLTDPEDARVLMPEQGSDIVAHFGEDHFLERYQRYKGHIAEWRQQYPKLAAVDLRYDQQVVLEMTPGASNAQTAVNAENGKPAAQPVQPAAETAKADPPRMEAAKPSATKIEAPRAEAHKSEAPKIDAHKPGAKTTEVARASKPHGTTAARAAQRAKEQRAELLAAKMRKQRLEAKRAALNKSKQKPSAKPHAGTPVGQGQ